MLQFAKATYAGLMAGLGSLVTVLVGVDGGAGVGLGDVSDGQWAVVVLFALGAAGGVYGIPYKAAGAGPR